LPLPEQVAVPLVGVLGRAEPGVLAHGPQPLAVHRPVRPSGERRLPGTAERRGGPVRRLVPGLDRDAGVGAAHLLPPGVRGSRASRPTSSTPRTTSSIGVPTLNTPRTPSSARAAASCGGIVPPT